MKPPAGFTEITEEVYSATGSLTTAPDAAISFLKEAAYRNKRRRARLCAHPNNADSLHEMLIAHQGGMYVQPHKHLRKSESFHMIEGRLKIFLFDDNGTWLQTIQMSPPGNGDTFYYRLNSETFHSVLPESEYVVFHEVTNGPFDLADKINAPWAPAEDDDPAIQNAFIEAWLNGIGIPPGPAT